MDSTGVGKLAREGNVSVEIEILGVGRRVKSIDFLEGDSLKTLLTLGTTI
jgi:hypothetical protein